MPTTTCATTALGDPITDFRDHFRRALGGSDAYNEAFVSHFYRVFLDRSPEAAAHFRHTDMSTQKTALFDSLLLMAEFPHSALARARILALGERHGRTGLDIRPALYDLWLEALIDTARHFDAQFDRAVELSWRVSMAPGITCMKQLYEPL